MIMIMPDDTSTVVMAKTTAPDDPTADRPSVSKITLNKLTLPEIPEEGLGSGT
ncbi:MAG: hypothetical protein WBM50_05385 [Acidimicrobiales bacterium]